MLACPICRGKLSARDGGLYCAQCTKEYSVMNGTPRFVPVAPTLDKERSDDLVYRVKLFFKRYPRVFFFLYNLIALFTGKSAKEFASTLPGNARIVSIGSGVKVVDERVINIDIAPGENVDIVASVYELPFEDGSIDAVISESLLEHLEYPDRAVAEIYRVLKSGGQIYILTPFMLGFHSSPHDFYRWTIPGLELLFVKFTKQDAGIAIGPSSALTALLREWCAMLLSFGSKQLYQLWTMFFMIVFIPLNLLDLLLARFSYASNIALAYYFIARKK